MAEKEVLDFKLAPRPEQVDDKSPKLLGVEVIPVNMRNAAEIEQSVESFARSPNGGLIPVSSAAAVRHRDLIITLAARHKLPAVYWDRFRRCRRPDVLWA